MRLAGASAQHTLDLPECVAIAALGLEEVAGEPVEVAEPDQGFREAHRVIRIGRIFRVEGKTDANGLAIERARLGMALLLPLKIAGQIEAFREPRRQLLVLRIGRRQPPADGEAFIRRLDGFVAAVDLLIGLAELVEHRGAARLKPHVAAACLLQIGGKRLAILENALDGRDRHALRVLHFRGEVLDQRVEIGPGGRVAGFGALPLECGKAGQREGEESGEQRAGGDGSLALRRGPAAREHQLQDFIAWRRRGPGLTVLPAFRIGKRAPAQQKRRRPPARDPLPGDGLQASCAP